MDFATIAVSVVTLLVPYIKKASEQFAGEAGKAVFQKSSDLLTRLKQYFAGDQAASDTISRFEQQPERYQPFLEDLLKEKLEKDLVFRDEIADLMKKIKEKGPEVKVIQKLKNVQDALGLEAGQISSGNVEVNQDVEGSKNIIGAKIDRIG